MTLAELILMKFLSGASEVSGLPNLPMDDAACNPTAAPPRSKFGRLPFPIFVGDAPQGVGWAQALLPRLRRAVNELGSAVSDLQTSAGGPVAGTLAGTLQVGTTATQGTGTVKFGTVGNAAQSPPGILSLPVLTVTGAPSWSPSVGLYPIIWNIFDNRPYLWNGSNWKPVAMTADLTGTLTGAGTAPYFAIWNGSSSLTSAQDPYQYVTGGRVVTAFLKGIAWPPAGTIGSGFDGTHDDIAPGSDSVMYQTGGTGTAIWTGIEPRVAAGSGGDGTVLGISNLDETELFVLKHADTGSALGNRFYLPGNTDYQIAPHEQCLLWYGWNVSGWMVLGQGNRPRKLASLHASVGNSSSTETTLHTLTMFKSQLSATDQTVEAQWGGTFVGHATATRKIKVYFGGTAIYDSGGLAVTSDDFWIVRCTIIRVSSTVVRYAVSLESTAFLGRAVGELTGLTLSDANIIKITGTAAAVGAASNDIVAKLGYIEWKPAA